MTVITRFAPSPTGYLHLGHAYAALFAAEAARTAGGRFLLRIEDIDQGRCRPAFDAAIREDLAWLGLGWEEPVRVQSAHRADYAAVLDALAARGLVYPCFCSRADIAAAANAPHGPEGPVYPGTCRALPVAERARRMAMEPHAWRLDMAQALACVAVPLTAEVDGTMAVLDPAPFGDVVLGRKDWPGSYHLCATHDDAVQGVTLVTRGEDLRPAVALHRLLQVLMGWPAPSYRHHALLLGPDGRRLSKRDHAATLRGAGWTAREVREKVGFLLF